MNGQRIRHSKLYEEDRLQIGRFEIQVAFGQTDSVGIARQHRSSWKREPVQNQVERAAIVRDDRLRKSAELGQHGRKPFVGDAASTSEQAAFTESANPIDPADSFPSMASEPDASGISASSVAARTLRESEGVSEPMRRELESSDSKEEAAAHHAWIFQQMADLDGERESRWRWIMAVLTCTRGAN